MANRKTMNLSELDIDEIEKKFAKMDSATALKMANSGTLPPASERKKAEAARKKASAKTTAKKATAKKPAAKKTATKKK